MGSPNIVAMTPVSGPRVLENWLTSWIEYTNALSSPSIFRKWAGISILSAVLERKVWVWTKGSALYPNLYIILVGPPGVGKSAVLSQVERVLRTVPELHVAPSSVSAASLVDSLQLANRKIIRPNEQPSFVQFHYLAAVASELGVFLPVYDPLFMNSLTKFYDGEHYEERRRSSSIKHTKLEHPHLSIIGGTTPSYLNSFLPEGAWDQGFTSRTIFVYSGEAVRVSLFGHSTLDETIHQPLLADLKRIGALYGKLSWDAGAASAIQAWADADLPPVPEHNKLQHYNTRRLAHVIKLCMVASIARSSDLRITLDDYQTALDWLLEAEARLPDLFHSHGVAGDSAAIDDAWDFIYRSYIKDGSKPVLEHRLVNFLRSKVPSHNIMKIIDIMERSKLLVCEFIGGHRAFKPGEKG